MAMARLVPAPNEGVNGRSGCGACCAAAANAEQARSIDKAVTPSYLSDTSPAVVLCVGSALKSAGFMVHRGPCRNACGNGTRAQCRRFESGALDGRLRGRQHRTQATFRAMVVERISA